MDYFLVIHDINLILVLMYLAMFRLEELTFKNYSKFLRFYDPSKMAQLIGFLFDAKFIDDTLKPIWFSILDAEYVKVGSSIRVSHKEGRYSSNNQQKYGCSSDFISRIVEKGRYWDCGKEI